MNASAFPLLFASSLPVSYLPRASLTTPVRLLSEFDRWSDRNTAPILNIFRNPDLLASVRAYLQGDLCLLKGRGRWEGQGTLVFTENLAKCVLLDDTRRREGDIMMSDGTKHPRSSCWWLGISTIATRVVRDVVKRRIPDLSGDAVREETICPVCLDDFKDISGTPIPCRNHHRVCALCYDRLNPKRCPTCRAMYNNAGHLETIREKVSVFFEDESHLCGVLRQTYERHSALTLEDKVVLESLWYWIQQSDRYGGAILNDDKTLSEVPTDWNEVAGTWWESFVIWFCRDGKDRLKKIRLPLYERDVSESRLIRILREIHGDAEALTLLAENTHSDQREVLRSRVWCHRFFQQLDQGDTYGKVLGHLQAVINQVIRTPQFHASECFVRITTNTTIE